MREEWDPVRDDVDIELVSSVESGVFARDGEELGLDVLGERRRFEDVAVLGAALVAHLQHQRAAADDAERNSLRRAIWPPLIDLGEEFVNS